MTTTDDLRALDIEIAKALGWTVRKGRDVAARLFDPNGGQIQGIAFSEANAWILAPNFTTDANAIDPLLEETGAMVEMIWLPKSRTWSVRIIVGDAQFAAADASKTIAAARAWLTWRRAVDGV